MDLHRERVLLVAAHVGITHEVEHVFVCAGAGAVKSSFTFAFECRVSRLIQFHCDAHKPVGFRRLQSTQLHRQTVGWEWLCVRCRAMFCKDLPQSTTDDIEFRLCADETRANEDIYIEHAEIFVQ